MVTMSAIVALLRAQIPGFSLDQAGSSFADLGVDSFGMLELRATVERAIGAPVTDAAWCELSTPAQLIAHLQRDAAALPSGHTPTTLRRRYALNMPQMALGGLSESWLFKELGDAHWSMITAGLKAPSSALCDDNGDRLYAALTRIRIEATDPLKAFEENEDVSLEGSIGRYGRGMFFSEIALHGARKNLKASLMSSFTKRGVATSNTSLIKGQPTIPAGCPIPDLAAMPDFGQGYRTQRGHTLAPTLFETVYDIVPYHDINGVGLLYFAAYPMVSDICELAYMKRNSRWAFTSSTVSRDIFYFANSDATDRIQYRVHARRETPDGIAIESSLSRVSDGTLMAYIVTNKSVVHA
ncbi:MAG TPA: Pnap_2097 family protein [Polyangia bacterium]|jgi:probable biosynthetic protein (TIGR04098 family)